MNYEKHLLCRPVKAFSILIFCASFFAACGGDLPDVPDEQSFSKEKLETLGTLLRNELLDQHGFLPDLPPYDTSVYWYVQTLYDQATRTIHLDKHSPTNDRWNQQRQWQVFVIKDDAAKLAFTLPGGDFFITTAMLRSFKKDYELYALLSFEAKLMSDGHLMKELVRRYNSLTINGLIESKGEQSALTAEELAQVLPSIAYDAETVETIDEAGVDNTCGTSILDPMGLLPFLDAPENQEAKWLLTRPSYTGRANELPGMVDDFCNNSQQGGENYRRFVLNQLD